jgi:hypothetical protein
MVMAKAKKLRKSGGSKPEASARSNRKLEALRRAQKIDEILLMGNVQSQAGSDSAAEERPAGESHIVNLLESQKMIGKSVFNKPAQSQKKAPPRKAAKPKKTKKAKKAKRR